MEYGEQRILSPRSYFTMGKSCQKRQFQHSGNWPSAYTQTRKNLLNSRTSSPNGTSLWHSLKLPHPISEAPWVVLWPGQGRLWNQGLSCTAGGGSLALECCQSPLESVRQTNRESQQFAWDCSAVWSKWCPRRFAGDLTVSLRKCYSLWELESSPYVLIDWRLADTQQRTSLAKKPGHWSLQTSCRRVQWKVKAGANLKTAGFTCKWVHQHRVETPSPRCSSPTACKLSSVFTGTHPKKPILKIKSRKIN